MDSRRIERIAAEWLARRDSENWDDVDQTELDAWLAESTDNRVAWLRLNAAWQRSDRLKALGAGISPGQIPERGRWTSSPLSNPPAAKAPNSGHGARSAPSHRHSKSRAWLGIAGAATGLVLCLASGILWWQYGTEEQAQYYARLGGIEEVSLADGSQATLGSDSYMEVTISRNRRRIDLQRGEVYFDVSHDPDRMFVVEAGVQRIVAVGTQFAVRQNSGELRVVVTEGKVLLESIGYVQHPPTPLTAGMIAWIDNGQMRIQEHSAEQAEELLSWRDGFLVFHDTPLSEAVAEFNRYSARKLVIVDAAIADIPIGGNFRWSNADAFVRLLEQGFDVHSEQREHQIILSGRTDAP